MQIPPIQLYTFGLALNEIKVAHEKLVLSDESAYSIAYNMKLPRGHMWFCWSLLLSTNRQHKYSAKHTEKECSVNKGRKYGV